MRSAVLFAVAGAAVGGGLVGALATSALRPEPVQRGASVSAPVVPPAAASDEGLAELRQAVERLTARIDALELAPASAPRLPADLVTRAELEALREQLAAEGERAPFTPLPDDATLRESVEATLRAVEKERAVAKLEAGIEEARASLDTRVQKYGDWLELDSYQRDQLREVLLEKSERDAALLRQWAEGVDREVVSERKRENAEHFAARVEALLGPEQLQRYRERVTK
jgi:hypothetical protein